MFQAAKSSFPSKKKPTAPKKPAGHPPYIEMIKAAIVADRRSETVLPAKPSRNISKRTTGSVRSVLT